MERKKVENFYETNEMKKRCLKSKIPKEKNVVAFFSKMKLAFNFEVRIFSI